MSRWLHPAISILSVLVLSADLGGQQDTPVSFNEVIRPIFSRHCLACHGPDKAQRKAGLRIDTQSGAAEVIDRDDPDESDLLLRIRSTDDDRMPPSGHGQPLAEDEIETIRLWIKQGAPFETHWAFVAPKKVQPAANESDHQAINEIDLFVLAQLKRQGLSPSGPATPSRLIRRLALDLTGLPPSQEMVQRYSKNPTPSVYEQIVDELLASPAFGEHWAAMWLDLARYADTCGYAEDRTRTIWPWRDWVIRAFNENRPFDQFTTEQIAGDLLDHPTNDQKLATAFHRNTLNNSEGGTSDEEFRTIAVKDRISTTVNVWMGLTLRCAECHTHKYDPISQKEYYQFLDFFNQTSDADRTDEFPTIELFPQGRESILVPLDRQIKQLRDKIAKQPPIWSVLVPVDVSSRDGTTLKVLDDHSVLSSGSNPEKEELTLKLDLAAGTYTGLRLEVIPDAGNGGHVGRSEHGNFVISQFRAALQTGDESTSIRLADAAADFSQAKFDIKLSVRDKVDDGGWAVSHPNQDFGTKRTAIFSFEKPLILKGPAQLSWVILHQSPWKQHNVGRVRLSSTAVEQPAAKFREKKLEPLTHQLAKLRRQRNTPVRVPIVQELEKAKNRQTHIMTRGSYLQPGEKVSAAVMQAFHTLPQGAPENRLGIAQWIVSTDNPLTARVTVNRFWARLFGRGIVATEEDFGTQGSLPTHPLLLDWLAIDFRDNGWNVKRLLKQIVMSATYRQSAVADRRQLKIDPMNIWLSRGPRFRLSAEVIRDQALAVSGLLSKKMYGPPVFPPNPVKRVVNAFTGGMTWTVSKGEDRYRRAVYTFIKRSSPHPLFDTFDMATREVCNLRRVRTNTPLQSFMTLNDESFVEAARALAGKMHGFNRDLKLQLNHGYQLAMFQSASDDQILALTDLYESTLAEYKRDLAAAALFAGVEEGSDPDSNAAELATLTVVANVILNLDSFLTK